MAWLNAKISEHTSTMIPTLIPLTESSCRASAPEVEMIKHSNPLTTKLHFDNLYFQNLVSKKALLHSDQELFNGSSTDNLVRKYATNAAAFFEDFAKGMLKMSNIKPLTGSQGQIRINCGKVN